VRSTAVLGIPDGKTCLAEIGSRPPVPVTDADGLIALTVAGCKESTHPNQTAAHPGLRHRAIRLTRFEANLPLRAGSGR